MECTTALSEAGLVMLGNTVSGPDTVRHEPGLQLRQLLCRAKLNHDHVTLMVTCSGLSTHMTQE